MSRVAMLEPSEAWSRSELPGPAGPVGYAAAMTADACARRRGPALLLAGLALLLTGYAYLAAAPAPCALQPAPQPPAALARAEPLVYAVVAAQRIGDRSAPCPHKNQPRKDLPMIYAITPTYSRSVQKADLTRLAQTLMWLDNFHWIVIEDAEDKTALVENLLKETSLQYTHLASRTKKSKQLKPTEPHWMKARGVEQRNAGLDWLRKNLSDDQLNGVLFFMDDDNTYALKIFEEMRYVNKVGVWPVGLVGGMIVERPLVDPSGKHIIGFNSVWRPERPFPIDMAGFSINLRLIKDNPKAIFTHKVQAGYQESEILRQLITRDELEPLADKCTKVYVWHTRTEKPKMNEENKLRTKNSKGSNDGIEV